METTETSSVTAAPAPAPAEPSALGMLFFLKISIIALWNNKLDLIPPSPI